MSLDAAVTVQLDEDVHREIAALAGNSADAIMSFCKKHDIVNELKNAVNLAEKCFQPSATRLEDDVDPETGDRNIVISLTVSKKSRQEVLAAYREFTQKTVKILPWPKSKFIRLSYDIS